MAGHSKWKQIKHKKAKTDSARGKQFTKLIKEITIAARQGGGDPAGNARLRTLIEKSKEINMPAENTARAIKKGTGELASAAYERYLYEGYGPGNSAVLVDVLTDNKNKAIAEVRQVFKNKGGTIAELNAVSWMFQKLGVIRIKKDKFTEDSLLELLIEHDIHDISLTEDEYTITCDPKAFDQVKQILKNAGCAFGEADIEWVAKNEIDIPEADEEKAYEFLQALEDLDDVQNVYTNLA